MIINVYNCKIIIVKGDSNIKKKGFTLIELLAVIVILGIITVIAVPKVLDIINKSRESAASSSIKLVKDAIKTQVASSDLTGPVFTKETDGCYLFDFDDQESGNAKVLEIKNKDKVSGSIKYCNNTFSDDTLEFNSNDSGSTKKVICKRATVLHTEECKKTSTTYDCSGAGYTTSGSKGTSTITYGNLGTNGTLSSGDAFDCDVNGDGEYDSETERFYYVSDYYNTNTKSFETNTAVLIYYNNTNAGVPDSAKTYSYYSSASNFYGPTSALESLPTISMWSNVSLKNTSRTILNETGEDTTKGGTLPSSFSYAGYAARLITSQEINKACNISIGNNVVGELDTCNYLLENTGYAVSLGTRRSGYWIESPVSSQSTHGWMVGCMGRNVYTSYVTNGNPVRPVIEVSKKNIEY